MKNFNPIWLLYVVIIGAVVYILKKSNDALNNDPNVSWFGQNLLDPSKVQEKAKTELPKQNSSVIVKSSLLKARNLNGYILINAVTKEPIYFVKEDGKIGEYIGNKVFSGAKYVAVKKTAETAQKWASKGLDKYDTVYVWRDAVTIK